MYLDEMTKTERVAAAVHGDEVDRIPVSFWHHFRPEGSGRKMAQATIDFFENTYDLDILKIMPDIPYPFPRGAIADPEGWRLLEHLNPRRSHYLNQRATAVRVLREAVGWETPIIMTIYNPLSEAMHFAQSRDLFLEHARQHPALVHLGLATIAENLRRLMRECIDNGADGIFFALQGCTSEVMSQQEYQEFGRPYDLLALQGAIDGWLNVLHVHGNKDLYFQQSLDYPVQVLSWSDRTAGPSLREARTMTSKCLMGGWNENGALANGPVEQIRAEAEDAIKQTGGRKLILANGCSVPDDTDPKWLEAARALVDELEVP
ncbi:MAG TPA: uroporphyrinogen decarboxylase family protein [Thermomicrobiaceae bacterium]|nr:uroporphyrinogen decarboxylase family protein [Thermomicrobiaceae bacterium]